MFKFLTDKILNGRSQTITSAAIILASASLASRFLGLIRGRLLVGAFGAGDKLDAYFAAFQVPDFAYNILILATLSVAFIPVFCDYLHRDEKEAWRLANSILNLTALVMGALCVLLFFGAPWLVRLVGPGFFGGKYSLTLNLTRILVLSPLIFSLSSVFSSILNSFRNFLAVAIAPLLYNLGIIFGILVLAPVFGIYGVAAGVIFGALMHLAIQIPAARKFGFAWRPKIEFKHAGVNEFLKLILPRFLAIDISQISQLVGTIIGSTLLAGSVAIFNLVYNIESVPIGVFAVSFVVAVFPSLSQAIARGSRDDWRKDFAFTARQILFLLIPLTILTFVFRAQLVRLIIGTKNLSWDETRLAAGALAIFSLSFVTQGIGPLLSRAFFSLKNSLIPLAVSLISVVVNVLTTYWFLALINNSTNFSQNLISILKLGGLDDLRILALPLGFSAASFFNALALVVILRFYFGALGGKKILLTILKCLVAGLLAGGAAFAGLRLFDIFFDTQTVLGILAQLSGATVLSGAVFVSISLLLKSEEMISLLGAIRRKMTKSVQIMETGDAGELR